MLRGIAGTVLVVLAVAAPAHATVLVDSGGGTPQPYQQWVSEARVPTVAGPVRMVGTGCPGDAEPACTSPGEPIWITRDKGQGWLDYRQMFLHELGHHFDYHMPSWVRDRFRAIMRNPRSWRSPPDSPHEQFAEGYSYCALGGDLARRSRATGTVGFEYDPSAQQNRAVCNLIRGL